MSKQSIENIRIEKEPLLRGAVLQVSSRIEMILLRIIIISNINDLETAINGFKAKTMNQKIVSAKDALKLKHPSLHVKHEKAFLDLDELRQFRNRFAHCAIEWEENSTSSFKIVEATAHKSTVTNQVSVTFQPFNYTMEKYHLELMKLNKVLNELVNLNNDIESILQQKHPHIYRSIN